jgi:hypothetical protein
MALITHYLKKRDFLWNPKTSKEALAKLGQEYFDAERYATALEFFLHAEDENGLEKIKAHALRVGDTFLLAALNRVNHHLVKETDWEKAAEKAEKAGRPSMAAFAARVLNPQVQADKEAKGIKPLADA